MKETLIKIVVVNLLPLLLKMLTPEMVKQWVNAGLDVLEKSIKESENKIDDAALPLIATIRAVVS